MNEACARYAAIADPWRGRVDDPMVALAELIGDVVAALAVEPVLQAEIRLGTESIRIPRSCRPCDSGMGERRTRTGKRRT